MYQCVAMLLNIHESYNAMCIQRIENERVTPFRSTNTQAAVNVQKFGIVFVSPAEQVYSEKQLKDIKILLTI